MFSSINTLILHSFSSSKHFIFSQIFSNRHIPFFFYCKKDDSPICNFICNCTFCFYVLSICWRIYSGKIYFKYWFTFLCVIFSCKLFSRGEAYAIVLFLPYSGFSRGVFLEMFLTRQPRLKERDNSDTGPKGGVFWKRRITNRKRDA